MHPSIICCYHLWNAHKASKKRHTTACVISEKSYDTDARALPRMLGAWESWASLTGTFKLSALDERALAVARRSDHVMVIAHDTDEYNSAYAALEALKEKILWPDYPSAGGWDSDALREVAHHDFELGGLNEWNGAPVQHSSVVLRRLSRVHCKEEFPSWAFTGPDGLEIRRRRPRRPLKVLDLGCGPISLLRWGMIEGLMQVSGLDPLLPMYQLLLARHGFDALEGMKFHRTFACTGEEMDKHVPAGEFDVVYTNNALDHTVEPETVVRNMVRSLNEKGRLIISVAKREGTRQSWDQFHKTDIWLEEGVPVYCQQGEPPRPLIPKEDGLRVTRFHRDDCWWLTFEAVRERSPGRNISRLFPVGGQPLIDRAVRKLTHGRIGRGLR